MTDMISNISAVREEQMKSVQILERSLFFCQNCIIFLNNDFNWPSTSVDKMSSLKFYLYTLHFSEDYPSGTWLGDEGNPEMRVRTAITPR